LAVFSSVVEKVHDDGPSLKLRAGFSVSLSIPHGVFYQSDSMEDEISSLNGQLIWPHLEQIYESIKGNIVTEMDTPQMFVIHERILFLPNTSKNKSQFLNMLGDIYKLNYETTDGINNLHQAICLYDDAIRGGVDNDPMGAAYLQDLGISLSIRFQTLGDLVDMNKSVLIFE